MALPSHWGRIYKTVHNSTKFCYGKQIHFSGAVTGCILKNKNKKNKTAKSCGQFLEKLAAKGMNHRFSWGPCQILKTHENRQRVKSSTTLRNPYSECLSRQYTDGQCQFLK